MPNNLLSSLFSRLNNAFTAKPFTSASLSPNKPLTMSSFPPNTQKATFASGCFWGVEHIFRRQYGAGKGLLDARVGYTGGSNNNPSYRAVCSGNTGHAEAVQIFFDPEKVSYKGLVDFFFRTHDPTTKNRQGHDSGTQYRSAIFANTEEQLKEAQEAKKEVGDKWKFSHPGSTATVSTQVEMAGEWFDAEDYHQEYLDKNRGGYECEMHFVRDKYPLLEGVGKQPWQK